MLVICSNCEARLQLDDGKVPSQMFKVRCPKCQESIDVDPAAANAEAGAVTVPAEMTPPAAKASPFERPQAAAQFKLDEGDKPEVGSEPAGAADLAKLLAAALRQTEVSAVLASGRQSWDRRKALICTSEENREPIARGLVTKDYDVFIAQNTEEALGRMREDRIDVLVLGANFDPIEQGYAFVTRELKLMQPSERRRLFLIYVTPSARTMDLHAAFLHNANLVVNQGDIERLPDALEVSIRHYNELYRDFNHALNMPAI